MNDLPASQAILENQPNFRSLDGISAAGGRRIKRNMLYRSGGLSRLSEPDITNLISLGICTVIDFRSDRERESHPTVHLPTVRNSMRIVINDVARDEAQKLMDAGDSQGMKKVLVNDYRRMIRHDHEKFAEFFQVLKETSCFPLVYHCAAGKDRTGLATLLLLSALGAGEHDIRQDYFASNIRLKALADKYVQKASEMGYDGEIVRPLMEVREEYLKAALDEIESRFGGMDSFLTNVLGVDFNLLREKFLDSHAE
jgi:protein-tyrosine phosphatase